MTDRLIAIGHPSSDIESGAVARVIAAMALVHSPACASSPALPFRLLLAMTADDVTAQAAAMLAPISDAKPGGDNASYDPNYDEIRTEVGKLDSPTGGEIDWIAVARIGQTILTTKSKDLLIASYTAYALLETKKLEGLAVGLAVLEGLFVQYWETMFPPLKRKRGRGNALGWLVGRLEIALPALAVSAADRPAFDLVVAGYKSLSTQARDRLEDHAPGMRSVSDAMQRIDLKLPKATAAAAAPQAPPAPAPAATAPTPPAPIAPETAAPPAPDAAPPAAAATVETPPEEPPKTDLVAELMEAAKPWLEPLGDPPHGNDARYEPEYETIRTEVTKLDSPTDAGEVPWDQVSRHADELLKTKSKDLLIASYLSFAWLETKGLDGLSTGLCVVTGLLEGYEALWPKRPRGRGAALSWLSDQVERRLGALKPVAKDRDSVEALKKIVRAFGLAARDKLEDHAPSVRPLEERVQRLLLAIPKPAAPKPAAPKPPPPTPTPAAAPAATPTPAPAAPPMPTATTDVGSAAEVGKYLLETGRAMVKAANLLRRAQPSSATAYRLIRIGLWLHLDKTPPSTGGKTQIPPLPAPRRAQLGLLATNEKWAALLEETESGIMQFRFCLDLQRLSAHALRQLGPEFEPARQGLLGEVASLLRRMPELPDLSAGNGTPLADEETRAWIATDVAAAEGGGGGGPSDDPGEEFAKIAPMVKGGKLGDAMQLAKDLIDATGSPRRRFIQRMALAQACLQSGQPKLARSMYAALDREMSERGLAEWEPALASRCLEGLVRSDPSRGSKGLPIRGRRCCIRAPVPCGSHCGRSLCGLRGLGRPTKPNGAGFAHPGTGNGLAPGPGLTHHPGNDTLRIWHPHPPRYGLPVVGFGTAFCPRPWLVLSR